MIPKQVTLTYMICVPWLGDPFFFLQWCTWRFLKLRLPIMISNGQSSYFNGNFAFMLQCVALEHGLILVDTKYEFGKSADGSVLLIDEVSLAHSLSLSLSLVHTSFKVKKKL